MLLFAADHKCHPNRLILMHDKISAAARIAICKCAGKQRYAVRDLFLLLRRDRKRSTPIFRSHRGKPNRAHPSKTCVKRHCPCIRRTRRVPQYSQQLVCSDGIGAPQLGQFVPMIGASPSVASA